jgi:hypothetical protein
VNNSSAKFLRVVTSSETDHVAITLKNTHGQVLIFESTGSSGVGSISWRDFLHYKCYSHLNSLRVRRLFVGKKNAIFYDKIEAIVNGTIGSRYELSVDKLFFNKSLMYERDQTKELEEVKLRMKQLKEEGRSFFCSELVAFIYKNLGFLPADKESASYWPSSFTSLQLVNGSSLEAEEIICFDPEECTEYAKELK